MLYCCMHWIILFLNLKSLTMVIFGHKGFHIVASSAASIAAILLNSGSVSDFCTWVATWIGALLLWGWYFYSLVGSVPKQRSSFPPQPSRLPLSRRNIPTPPTMPKKFYWQQEPLGCDHPSCRAGAAPIHLAKRNSGLNPFMQEQWELAAPGSIRSEMTGESFASLNVTRSHHLGHFISCVKKSWEDFPQNALAAVSTFLHTIIVRPVLAIREFLKSVNWPLIYWTLGLLFLVHFASKSSAPEPVPQRQYEEVLSYHLVPDVKRYGTCLFWLGGLLKRKLVL